MPAVAQHLGLLTHLKAWSYARQNSFHNCLDTLWIDEKDTMGANKLQTHPSSAYSAKLDEVSCRDVVYQKQCQSHPHYYFNNLGLVHMKLKKYNMAIYYFSKAVKFLERSNDKIIGQQ